MLPHCKFDQHKSLITSFCSSLGCLQFFCSNCEDSHKQQHISEKNDGKINSIEGTKEILHKKISRAIDKLQDKIIEYTNQNNLDFQEKQLILLQKLQEARNIIQQIDSYFSSISDTIKNHIQQNQNKVFQITQNKQEIENYISILKKLQTQVISNPQEQLKEPFSKACRLDIIHLVNTIVGKYLSFNEKDRIYPFYENINNDKLLSTQSLLDNIFSINIQNQALLQDLQSQIQLQNNPFMITQKNYLNSSNQFLSCFIDQTTYLRIFNIESKKWQDVDINFKIPVNHCSITIPNGKIYISGGISNSQNQAYIGILLKNTIQKKQLQYSRSCHSMIYLEGWIFIIGGILNDGDYTKIVEKYNVENDQVQRCSDCYYKSYKPSLCSFQNKYIYKFVNSNESGKNEIILERYAINTNIWEIIQFKNNNSLINIFQSSACIQINEENILIFGGENEFETSIKKTFLIQIKNDIHLIVANDVNQLPKTDEFYNRQIIIYKNQLYVMQNVKQKNQKDMYTKRILLFDQATWKELK
ncbi:unnamed protein product [Paramecium sonneborni]|uniref:B box-type domain-containing protein n=1 Tax=Paramecium sonneborni TaxID=65129 RepID=A0A8S1L814_9CILI|nr:unnamed protein product [Paramecium sonneborni]